MARDYTISIGTVGGGLSFSPDGGDTWNRIRDPIPSECNVRALTVYPDDPAPPDCWHRRRHLPQRRQRHDVV